MKSFIILSWKHVDQFALRLIRDPNTRRLTENPQFCYGEANPMIKPMVYTARTVATLSWLPFKGEMVD